MRTQELRSGSVDELLDLLDERGESNGRGKPRQDVHRDGDWHRAFHLWVVRPGGHVLLQRRSKQKDLEGGKIDVSVAGHYRFGETIRDVVREADEEIGLVVRPGGIDYLTTIRSERRYAGEVDREFQEVYVCRDARELREFRTDCSEVSVLYDAPIAPVIDLYRGTARSLPVAGYDCQDRVNNALLIEEDLIAQARSETAQSLVLVQAWAAERESVS